MAVLATEEAPEVFEAEARRPAIKRPRRSLLAVRRQVPLADRRSAIAVVAQDTAIDAALRGHLAS